MVRRHMPAISHAPGDEIARRFGQRLLLRHVMVVVVGFFAWALLAPWSLRISTSGIADVWLSAMSAGAATVVVSALLSAGRLRAGRAVFRALALEPERITPQDISTLALLPSGLALRFAIVGSAAAALTAAPGFQPSGLDQVRSINLALLGVMVVSAAAVVHYVVSRALVVRAIEIAPLAPVTAYLEEQAIRLAPRRRVVQKVMLALVAPVTLVGVVTLLVSHAHQRDFIQRSRHTTARQLTTLALDTAAADVGARGREDAMAATAAHGFYITVQRDRDRAGTSRSVVRQIRGGLYALERRRDDERATTRYEAKLAGGIITSGVWMTIGAALVSALLAWWLGRLLAADLVLATQQVSSLGTEKVMRGEARVAGPARFEVVEQLGRSVEALAERFRQFAGGQERALEAKAAAQRMKQLLFASVSHDLKSPLSAILGLAQLIHDEPLSPSQRECLQMVSSRGRELLALIETILDAARVEAGQLRLNREPVATDRLIQEALTKAGDLLGARRSVLVELAPQLPALNVDPAYTIGAFAVLLAHAIESASTAHGRTIRVRASLPAVRRGAPPDSDNESIRLDIEYVASGQRPSLLEEQLRGRMRTDAHRGMALRLSLARSIIELHGGRMQVGRGPQGAAVVTCWLPRQLG